MIQKEIILIGTLGVASEDTSGMDAVLWEALEESMIVLKPLSKETLGEALATGEVDATLSIETTDLLQALIAQSQPITLRYNDQSAESISLRQVIESEVVKLATLLAISDGTLGDVRALK